jgi:predicted lipoprotein with Yx(FWY)xxD motif
MRNRWLVGPGLVAAAVVLTACAAPANQAASSSSAPASAQAAGVTSVTIKTMSTSKGTVLTNAHGRTLYWFAKDTAGKSNCNGSCASYWPPVIGSPVAASGAKLSGKFGTIKRADGETQATYDGHPLYTYAGDTAKRQVKGNGLNVSGGLWWAATPSGSTLGAKKKGSSSGSGSSGSGSSGSGSGSSGGGW